jgi:hypothetical protein
MRMKGTHITALLCAAILVVAPGAFAARPLFIEDVETTAEGTIDLEFGLSHANLVKGGRAQILPALSLTYGFPHNLDLGLNIERINSRPKGESRTEGFEDLHLAAKYWLPLSTDPPQGVAFSFDLKIPTASRHRGLSSGRTDETFTLIGTKAFNSLFFDLNFGYVLVDSPPKEKLKNRVLGGMAARWEMPYTAWMLVGEISGQSREAKGEKNQADFKIGAMYEVHECLTLDAALGRGLLTTGASVEATVGLTVSLPLFEGSHNRAKLRALCKRAS